MFRRHISLRNYTVSGYCGTTTSYCGTGCQPEFGTCVANNGDDDDDDDDDEAEHCKAPDCLFLFGPACDANRVPGGSNTSAVARPPLGRVLVGGGGIYACEAPGTVALTYDDGPGEFTAGLLDLLAEHDGAKATFFVTGVNNNKGEIDDPATPWPGVIRRMYEEGHQIASHTWSHADLSAISSARRRDEMVKNEMALRNVLGGLIPTYMRPPYSSCTAESGCQADLAALGYHVVYFDLDTTDYLHTGADEIQVAIAAFDAFFAGKTPDGDDGDSALAIAHDIHEQSATTLTRHMLEYLAAAGYRTVTVGECLGDPAGNWYRRV
ncbi:hypothetical protein SLS62_000198 [Diatrype stigma]|uniref:NodB homology domain-containing protein n=1 Tax=Diatrype stigma TaxID=117547 RepID=A0AAN9YXV9_9PEZI